MNATLSTTAYPGALDRYLQEIARTPLLTKSEERELAIAQRRGEAGARERLIRANLRLVVSIAKKFCGLGVSIEDLISEGNRGLIKAVERYNPDVGASLCTYATWWIRQSVSRAIENHGRTIRLPAHVLTQLRKLRAAGGELAQVLGREPDEMELAEHLGITGAKLTGMRMAHQSMHPLDEVTPDGRALHETLAADGGDSGDPYSAACHGCDTEQVQKILSTLPERLRFIIEARFGIGREPLTLAGVGKRLGVTRERTRQLESRAMSLLRQALYRMDPGSNAGLLSFAPPVRSPRIRKISPGLCAAA